MRQSARRADVRSDILNRVSTEEHFELEDRMESLTGGDGDVNLVGDVRHGVEVVGKRGVFVEKGMKRFDVARKNDRFGGRQATVNPSSPTASR